jgi:preprotein translocase subunit YajC
MFFEVAHAMGTGAEGGVSSGGGLGALLPLVIMFVIFYFLLIRPQQKKQKAHQQLLGNLRKGDRVLTNGGLYGTVTGLTDTELTLEIAPKIRVKVARGYVASIQGGGSAAPAPATPAEEK